MSGYFFTGYSYIIIGLYSFLQGVNISRSVLISYLVLLTVASLQSLIHGLEYMGFVKLIFFLPFIYFTASFVINRYYPHDTGIGLVKDLVILTFINSLLSYGALLSRGFADTFYKIVYVNPKLFDYPIFRPSGLFFDGYSYASSFNTIVVIVAITFIVERAKTLVLLFFGTMLFIILANNLFLGRFGIVIFLLYIPIYIFRKYRSLLTNFISSKTILMLIVFTLVVRLILNTQVSNYVEWALSFIELFSSKQSNSTASELLSNHYNIHLDGYELLFGNPMLRDGLSIDPGIFRIINFGGLILLMAFTVFFLTCFRSVYKVHREYRHILITILVFFIVANFKDVYIVSPYAITFIYCLLYINFKNSACAVDVS